MKFKHIISLICLIGAIGPLAGCGDTGSGEKVGFVTRVVADSGVFCKTNEVEVQRGGMNAGSGVVGAAFHVTVTDPAMFKQLQDAMENQTEVKIKYRKEFATFCRSDSPENAFLTSVDSAQKVVKPVSVEAKVNGIVTTTQATPAQVNAATREDKIEKLLATQAQLINELAAERNKK